MSFYRRHHTRRRHTSSRSRHKRHFSKGQGFKNKVLDCVALQSSLTIANVARCSWISTEQYTSLNAGHFFLSAYNIEVIESAVMLDAVRRIVADPATASVPSAIVNYTVESHVSYARIYSQVATPVCIKWYLIVPRFDIDSTPQDLYTLSQTSYVNTSGASGTVLTLAEQLGTSIFDFKPVCQCFKVVRSGQTILNPGEMKEYHLRQEKPLQVTIRMQGVEVLKGYTKYLFFEFSGAPVNDQTIKTNVMTYAGAVNVSYQERISYKVRPLPYQVQDWNNNETVAASPQTLEYNNPTVTQPPTEN